MLFDFVCDKITWQVNRKEQSKKSLFAVLMSINFSVYFLISFANYSHSMVAGGLELISYTTLFTPFTLLIISLLIFAKNSYGK